MCCHFRMFCELMQCNQRFVFSNSKQRPFLLICDVMNQYNNQRMKCPFLTKISFKKVSQVISDDAATEDMHESENEYVVGSVADEENFDLSEQTIEIINSSNINKHDIYYFNCKLNIPESSNQHLEIKYPKQFCIKPMISREMQLEEENHSSEIINESEMSELKNVPHHLISKMSMMCSKCQDIFYGQVILEDQNQNNCECQIKDKIIKIISQGKIKYYIEMAKVKCTVEQIRTHQLVLSATCKNNALTLKLKFPKGKKMNSFIKAIQLNNIQITQEKEIEEFVVCNKLNASYSLDSLGFEVQRMSIEQLRQVGDTFDIILFKNRTMMSKVQRILTNSDYDHVAMLLKTSNNELFILQSSSNAGVSVYTLKSLIDLPRKKYYYRVGLRRYTGERTYAHLINLQQFIRQAIGKKYKFDPMYLLSSEVKKGDTFFCSELVAEALQRSGIMSKDKPSYKFLPKHIADDDFNEEISEGSYSEIIIVE